jgi:uncharacterized membrane protein YfcA
VTLPLAVLLVAGLAFLLAGIVKGVIGLGLPTVAMGLLVLVTTPAEAAAMLIVPSLVTNVWQLATGPSLTGLVRRLWPMMAGICVGAFAGAGLLARTDATLAGGGLGAALVLYGVLGLSGVRFSVPSRLEPWLSPLVGAATGVVTGATGVFVIPAVPYLQALGLGKDDLVQALGLSFTVSTVALAGGLAGEGAFRVAQAGTSVLALLPALAGMLAGQRVRRRVSARAFRLCFFAGLLVLGTHSLLQALVPW